MTVVQGLLTEVSEGILINRPGINS